MSLRGAPFGIELRRWLTVEQQSSRGASLFSLLLCVTFVQRPMATRTGAPLAERPGSSCEVGNDQRTLVPLASHTSTVPRFRARIGASILDRSPATTTVTALGVTLLPPTRAMSAAVTAAARSR